MSAVTIMIGKFKQGSSSAFGDLFGRFFDYPADLADRHMGRASPVPQDGEDIAQMVFLELYCSVREHGHLRDQVRDTASLLRTLALLTRQQVRRQWRNHTRHCRDVRRSRLATDLSASGDSDPLNDVCNDVSWLREIESDETIEQLLALLPDARHRTLVQLRAQGFSLLEIAQKLGRSARAVERYVTEIRTIWQNHPEGHAILSRYLPLLVAANPRQQIGESCRLPLALGQ